MEAVEQSHVLKLTKNQMLMLCLMHTKTCEEVSASAHPIMRLKYSLQHKLLKELTIDAMPSQGEQMAIMDEVVRMLDEVSTQFITEGPAR